MATPFQITHIYINILLFIGIALTYAQSTQAVSHTERPQRQTVMPWVQNQSTQIKDVPKATRTIHSITIKTLRSHFFKHEGTVLKPLQLLMSQCILWIQNNTRHTINSDMCLRLFKHLDFIDPDTNMNIKDAINSFIEKRSLEERRTQTRATTAFLFMEWISYELRYATNISHPTFPTHLTPLPDPTPLPFSPLDLPLNLSLDPSLSTSIDQSLSSPISSQNTISTDSFTHSHTYSAHNLDTGYESPTGSLRSEDLASPSARLFPDIDIPL